MKNKIEQSLKEILILIAKISAREYIDYIIAGATARDLIFWNMYNIQTIRKTMDVDVAICVKDWDDYNRFVMALLQEGGTQRQDNNRLYFKNYPIDIIPFGKIAHNNQITWPPNYDTVLNITGFDEICKYPVSIDITKTTSINVAAITGQVVLKLISWNDQPTERKKDISDLLFILNNYDKINPEEKLYQLNKDLLLEENFDYELTWTRILGRDVTSQFAEDLRATVINILDKEINNTKTSLLLLTLSQNSPSISFDRKLQLMKALMIGLRD